MDEVGVNISTQQSKHFDELKDISFDYVVTVCGHAEEHCPVLPQKTKHLYVGFDDPPTLAREIKGKEEHLIPYRRVRDEIRVFVETLPDILP